MFDKVPTDPQQTKEFDAQMRELIATYGITESLAIDEPGAMRQLCAVLAKTKDGKSAWTRDDREWLLDLVEKLYE